VPPAGVGAGALTTSGTVKTTGAAPDAVRTLAGGGLADRSNDSPACAPNHAAGGGGTCAGGRGLGCSNASVTSAARGVGAAAPGARAGAWVRRSPCAPLHVMSNGGAGKRGSGDGARTGIWSIYARRTL
jgi:hypothetical protein